MTAAFQRLGEVLARAPEELVTASVRDRLIAVADRHCSEPDMTILECRVSEDFDEQVDLSTAVVSSRARRAFAAHAAGLASSGGGEWDMIARLAQGWLGDQPELRGVSGAYLEFDVAADGRDPAVPSLFLRTTPLVRPDQRQQTIAEVVELVGALGGGLAGLSPHLRHVLFALPRNFHLAYLGLMFPRAQERLRLCLTLPAPEVAGFFDRLGLPLDFEPWTSRLRWTQRAGWLDVAVGLGASGLEGRIGIEACARGGSMPLGGAAVIEHLAALGLCTPGKRRSLLAVVERAGTENAPFELSHVKVALSTSAEPRGKAYLCARVGARARGLAAIQRMPGTWSASQASGATMPSAFSSSRLWATASAPSAPPSSRPRRSRT
jgi:hypothetical protein